MTGGALFVVILPRKEVENDLRNKEKTAQIFSDTSINDDKTREHKLNIEVDDKNVNSNSTCCDGEKSGGLYKSSGGDDVVDGSRSTESARSSIKSSWEDLKQAIKPKRNKFKITNPEITDVLATFHDVPHLETMLLEIIKRLKIVNASWTLTKNNEFWQVIFSVNNNTVCEETLQVLRTFGIGSKYQSSFSIIPCALYYQSQTSEDILKSKEAEEQNSQRHGQTNDPTSAWTKFTSSVSARHNLAQVIEDVRADAALTFDWLNLLIIASLVSAIGLVENSVVILVASMLISPLMGPITAGTIGTIMQDRSLQRLGLQNEIAGLFMGLIIGFVFGLAICALDESYGIQNWPTSEMMSRCTIRAIWVNVAVAIPSGVGVALAVLGEYTASLVGVAISASLLPPAVNAGLLWAMALVHFASSGSDVSRWSGVITSSLYSSDPVVELMILGAVSLCLTLVNIVFIFLAGVAVYKVKDVSPFKSGYISWWRASRSARRPTGGGDNGWNINRWYNEPTEINGNIQTSPDVESDTTSFKKPSPIPKKSVQQMQDYYIKETQVNGFKTNFDINHTTSGNENDDSFEPNTDTSIEDSLEKTKTTVEEKNKSRKVSFGAYQENKLQPKRTSIIDERKRELFSSIKGNM